MKSPYKEASVWFNPKISMYGFGIIIFLLPKNKNGLHFGISTASKKCSQLNDKLQEERNSIFFELFLINTIFPEHFSSNSPLQ